MSVATSLARAPNALLPGVPMPHHMVWLTRDADKQFYAEVARGIDALILTANLLEHSFESVQAFLASVGRPFLIHPQLHRFQHPGFLIGPAGSLKPNLGRLAAGYGAGTDLALGQQALRGSDITPQRATRLVRNILEYQCDRLLIGVAPLFLDLDVSDLGELRPAALIGPALLLRAIDEDYEAALRLSKATVDESAGMALVEIRITAQVLANDGAVDRLVTDFGALATPAFLLSVTDLCPDVVVANSKIQINLIRVVLSLAAPDRRVYVLFGGYTAALLRWAGATGYAHGMAPTEPDARAEPVRGQPRPPLRHYAGGLHRAVPYDLMRRAVEGLSAADYHRDQCPCQVCRRVINGEISRFAAFLESEIKLGQHRRQPTGQAERLNTFHLLLAKQLESRQLSVETAAATIARLRKQAERLRGKLPVDTLIGWAEFVERMAKGHQPGLKLTVRASAENDVN